MRVFSLHMTLSILPDAQGRLRRGKSAWPDDLLQLSAGLWISAGFYSSDHPVQPGAYFHGIMMGNPERRQLFRHNVKGAEIGEH